MILRLRVWLWIIPTFVLMRLQQLMKLGLVLKKDYITLTIWQLIVSMIALKLTWTFMIQDSHLGDELYLFLSYNITFFSKNSSFTMTSSMRASYTLNMTAGTNASIILSDPNYFITNGNPITIPKLKIQINSDYGFRPYYVTTTKVQNMNTKSI